MRKLLSLLMALVLGFTFANAEATRIYCKVTQSWWTTDNAAVGIYTWNDNGDPKAAWPGERMTAVEGEEGVWYVDLDLSVYKMCIFTRVNGSGDVSDWGAKTDDQLIPTDGKNLFTITSEQGQWDGAKTAGEWSVKDAAPVDPVDPVDPQPSADPLRVYCKVAQDWWKADNAAVAAYAWTENAPANAEWPGVRMQAVEGEADVWYIDLDTVAYEKVVFTRVNPGNEGDFYWNTKTADQIIPRDGKNLFTITTTEAKYGDEAVSGEWSVKGAAPVDPVDPVDPQPSADPLRVYCKVAQDWWTAKNAAVAAFAWTENAPSNAEWPGVRMAAVEGEAGVWYIDLDTVAYQKVVFARVNPSNDGDFYWGAKTEDQIIPRDGKNLFTITSAEAQWDNDGKKAAGEWSVKGAEPAEQEKELPVVVLAGTMNEWSETANILTPAEDSLTASVTVHLQAQDYEFKMIVDGKYLSVAGENDKYTMHRDWHAVENVNQENVDNFKLAADVAGAYTFTWTYANNKLDITFPEKGEGGEGGEEQGKVLPIVALAGAMNEWSETANILTPAEDSLTASVTVNLQAQDYEFKMFVDGKYLSVAGENDKYTLHRDWHAVENVNQENVDNFKLAADVAGAYTFTWTYASNKLDITFPEKGEGGEGGEEQGKVLPIVALAGAMNEWSETANILTPAEDSLTASVTVHLQAQDYEFKMIVDGKYLSVAGENDKYTLHRDWHAVENVNQENVDNFKLTADVAGAYTFTWTYANNKLDITFPEKGEGGEGGETEYLLLGSAASMGAWQGDGAAAFVDGVAEVTVPAGDCEFKVVPSDWNWDNALAYAAVDAECSSNGISEGDNGNIKVTMKEEGTLRVEIKDGKLCVTGNFVADEPIDNTEYLLFGSAASMGAWNGDGAAAFVDGVAEVTVPAGDCEFKVVPSDWNWEKALAYADVDAECSSEGISEGDNGNIKVNMKEEGKLRVEIKDGKLCVTGNFVVAEETTLTNGFYLIGPKGWTIASIDAKWLFSANQGSENEYQLTVTLAENDPIKVVKVENNAIITWYPDGMDNAYIVDAAHAGNRTIYFQETYKEDWAAFGGYFYVSEPTAVENITNDVKAVKFIENGQIFIIANGHVFGVMGQIVR